MTAFEAYELTTQGGGTDFVKLIAACELYGPYCLIGGLTAMYPAELRELIDSG